MPEAKRSGSRKTRRDAKVMAAAEKIDRHLSESMARHTLPRQLAQHVLNDVSARIRAHEKGSLAAKIEASVLHVKCLMMDEALHMYACGGRRNDQN